MLMTLISDGARSMIFKPKNSALARSQGLASLRSTPVNSKDLYLNPAVTYPCQGPCGPETPEPLHLVNLGRQAPHRDASCEWSSWFRSQHESWSWAKRPSDFDQAGWMLRHTAFVNRLREEWEDEGHVVTTEAQNAFTLRGVRQRWQGSPTWSQSETEWAQS